MNNSIDTSLDDGRHVIAFHHEIILQNHNVTYHIFQVQVYFHTVSMNYLNKGHQIIKTFNFQTD